MNQRTVLTLNLRVTDTQSGAVLDRAFDRFPIRVGRSPLNDLPIESAFVSQFHLVIEKSEQTLLLRDLGGRNGTLIAGQRVTAHQKHDLAPAQYTFEIGPLRFQGALAMMPKVVGSEQTSVLMAVTDDPATREATRAFQAFVDVPTPAARNPADMALQGLQHLAATFAPQLGALDSAESVLEFLRKMKQSLDLLFGAFVPLRDAIRQVRLASGAPPSTDPEAAHITDAATTASHIASSALDWRSRSGDALRAIQSVLADAVIDELALPEGARRLLGALAPKTVESLFAQQGSSMRFGPFREAALWRLYCERHKQLDDAAALALLFGDTGKA